MKKLTYTDPDSTTAAFVVKVRGDRHRFVSGKEYEVADDVAAAVKSAAEDGRVTIHNIPKDD